MSSKKGPGRFVAAHQTEAARRALIQPVPCWEYKWVVPPGMPSNSPLRLRQWVKTDKKQEFSDDEDESQAPLAPLPDEPEGDQADDDDDDDDQDKEGSAPPAQSGLATPMPAETSMQGVPGLDTPISGAITPASSEMPAPINLASRLAASANKPHPLASSFVPEDEETNMETMDTNEPQLGSGEDQGMMEGETSLLDSIEMGIDGMNENSEAYMDMLNSGDLDLGDGMLNDGMVEEPQ